MYASKHKFHLKLSFSFVFELLSFFVLKLNIPYGISNNITGANGSGWCVCEYESVCVCVSIILSMYPNCNCYVNMWRVTRNGRTFESVPSRCEWKCLQRLNIIHCHPGVAETIKVPQLGWYWNRLLGGLLWIDNFCSDKWQMNVHNCEKWKWQKINHLNSLKFTERRYFRRMRRDYYSFYDITLLFIRSKVKYHRWVYLWILFSCGTWVAEYNDSENEWWWISWSINR